MNLFILSNNPNEAAKKHCDKHVVKMILEACQMLYTAHWVLAYPHLLNCKSAVVLSRTQKQLPLPCSLLNSPTRKDGEQGFRPVHVHHPCTQWIRSSRENYIFACELAIALGKEYRFRWSGIHSCSAHAEWLRENIPLELESIGLTPFAIAMDNQFKISKDPVECYRYYYKTSKRERGLLKYTRRAIPGFILQKTKIEKNENSSYNSILD